MSILFKNFCTGMRVRIFEGLHYIDDAIITSIEDEDKKRVKIRSLTLRPNEESTMIFLSEENLRPGWYFICPGIFDEPCLNHKGPVYALEPI